MRFDADVAVVGAGPVGCVAALAHAHRGVRVALFDANPDADTRFAGELLHPAAVKVLRDLGIHSVPPAEDHSAVKGFAVLGKQAPDGIVLDYAGETGITFEFNHFVKYLRSVAIDHPLIEWRPHHRITEIDGQTLHFHAPSGDGSGMYPLIVGADGKFSRCRKSLDVDDDLTPLSAMAGLLLKGVTLPFEGYGHVVISEVGPALVYRIGKDEVRVCMDVPTPWRRAKGRNDLIWNAYKDVLPTGIAPAIKAALDEGRVVWAVNGVRTRTCYGRPGLALIGDAVGHVHPMTAAGMTLGFADAEALARLGDVDAYAAERRKNSESPAILATALYEIFALDTEPTRACREAIFNLWNSPRLRRKTMSFLSGEDTSVAHLMRVGVTFVGKASFQVVREGARPGQLRSSLSTFRRIAGLLHWLANESVPEAMRIPFVTAAATPFEALRLRQLEVHAVAAASQGRS